MNATATTVGASIFLFHLIRRYYETCYVSVFSGATMNLIHYVAGYVHYIGSICSIVAHSVGIAPKGDFISSGLKKKKFFM